MKPWPWPPVIVTPSPAASIRGPSMSPESMACARSMLSRSAAPRSRTVVTPACRVRRACSAAFQARTGTGSLTMVFRAAASPELVMCTWQSISPGMTKPPAASRAGPPSPPCPGAATASIMPARQRTSAARNRRASESNTRPPRMMSTASTGMAIECGEGHRPHCGAPAAADASNPSREGPGGPGRARCQHLATSHGIMGRCRAFRRQ